jgi:hypothetical protein
MNGDTLRGRIVSLATSVALHAAFLGLLLLLPTSPRIPARPAEGRPIAVAFVTPVREPTAAESIAESLRMDASAAPRPLRTPDFAVDISRVQTRQHALFPLLTQGLPVLDEVRANDAAREVSLTWFDPAATPRSRSGLPPLLLSDTELMHLVDAAWSRRDRWQNFVEIASLITEHDPDAGRSAELVRAHLDRNLLQPYTDATTRDPRFWVMLNMAADQEPMIRFVSAFVREQPSTRVSTELLFLLDEYVQASRDGLVMLLATNPEYDLVLTRESDPAAYELAVSIRNYYAGWLEERGLEDLADIRLRYDSIRLRVLTTILQTTPAGYGAADARYLIGRIQWDQGETGEAMSTWREVSVDDRGMYEPFYSRIRSEVRAPSGATAARIGAVLGAEHGPWRTFSRARLWEFGFTSNSV